MLRSLGVDPDVESTEDRFRVFDDVTKAVRGVAGKSSLVVILDDIHWADEPSLLVLRHLADQIPGTRLLVFTAFRDAEPASILHRVLPDLLRSPAVERLDLHGFDLAEVREQLSRAAADESMTDASAVLEVTGGNPLFVREVARAMADGTWRPDRPPRTVLDVVRARLDRVSAGCRRLLQAAAIVGRDFSLALVAAALDEPVAPYLSGVDEAIAYGLLDRVGDVGEYRFVHALTRDAVEASLTTAERVALHRAVAEATEAQFAGDLSEHLAEIARHWAELAPYGEAATARTWAIREVTADPRANAVAQQLCEEALAGVGDTGHEALRARLLAQRGHLAFYDGDQDRVESWSAAALDLARHSGDDRALVEALHARKEHAQVRRAASSACSSPPR